MTARAGDRHEAGRERVHADDLEYAVPSTSMRSLFIKFTLKICHIVYSLRFNCFKNTNSETLLFR